MGPVYIKRYPPRISNIWAQRWSKIPRYSIDNLETDMRKILIYYPKNLKALIPITTEFSSERAYLAENADDEELITRLETRYRQILAKYKRSYIRHQNIDIAYEDPSTYRLNRLDSLRIHHSKGDDVVIPRVLSQGLKLGKGIKHLEIDGSMAYADVLILMRYIPSLESLYIDNFPLLSREGANKFVKSVLASKNSLKNVTLIGSISINPSKLFNMLKKLHKLKTVNLDGKFESNFDVSKIPYKMFKERGIHFNIRIPHNKPELKIETINKSGLVPVDFLGISYKHKWFQKELVWDSYHEDHIKFQEKAKRTLFVNFPPLEEKPRLSKLFRHCKNVEVFDICLVRNLYKPYKKDFENFKYFENLKHIFIELDSIKQRMSHEDTEPTFYDVFFKELTLCAPTLRSVHLHLYGEANLKGELANFFKACTDSLTHVTLKISYFTLSKPNNMNGIYSCLKELKQIESLKMIYENFRQHMNNFDRHANQAIFVSPTLKEISIMAQEISINQLNLDFKSLTNLEKMQLCIASLDDNSIFFRKTFIIPSSLKRIELNLLGVSQNIWNKLLVQFDKLPVLEILMLKIEKRSEKDISEITKGMALTDIKLLIKGHRSLKLVTYSGAALDNVSVFVEDVHCYREDDIQQFYAKKSQGVLRKRTQKIFRIQKEIKEQVIAEEPHGGLKKLFLGLFSKVMSHYDATNG